MVMESCLVDLVHVHDATYHIETRQVLDHTFIGIAATVRKRGQLTSTPPLCFSEPSSGHTLQRSDREMERSAKRPPQQRERAFCFPSPGRGVSAYLALIKPFGPAGISAPPVWVSILWQLFRTTSTWSETPEPWLHCSLQHSK